MTDSADSRPNRDFAYRALRQEMVHQIQRRGIHDKRVLAAIATVPRHIFMRAGEVQRAYEDCPRPIGYGQTISQPYIVALMTTAAQLTPTAKVLEIGTGSGYQTAILAELAYQVYSIERIPELGQQALRRLQRLGYDNIELRQGDGYYGWPEAGPYDAIVVTAAPPQLPPTLESQLVLRGRLVIPVGDRDQELLTLVKTETGLTLKETRAVSFVPLISNHEPMGEP